VETDTIGTVQEIYRRLTGGPAAPTER
jgi:hypothetical protein